MLCCLLWYHHSGLLFFRQQVERHFSYEWPQLSWMCPVATGKSTACGQKFIYTLIMNMNVMVIWALNYLFDLFLCQWWTIVNHILCLNLFCMFSNPHRVKRIHTPPLISLYKLHLDHVPLVAINKLLEVVLFLCYSIYFTCTTGSQTAPWVWCYHQLGNWCIFTFTNIPFVNVAK